MTDLSPAARIHLAGVLTALSSSDPIERGLAAVAAANLAQHHQINWLELLASPAIPAASPQASAGATSIRPPPPPPPIPREHEPDLWMLLTNPTRMTPADQALVDALAQEPDITVEQRQELAVAAERIRAAGGWTPSSGNGFRTSSPADADPLTRYGYQRPKQ